MTSEAVRTESGYSNIDQTGAAMRYVRRLDSMRATPFWRAIKERTYELLDVHPGDSVLDVGCGTGDDVRAIADLVQPGGRVAGVDSSAAMIGEARRRSEGQQLTVQFEYADAHGLPFDDGTFDACRVERVLQHVSQPERALGEMVRVLRPGGRLVVVEPDYETLTVSGADPRLTRKILAVRRDHFRSARIGIQIPILCRKLGVGHLAVQIKILSNGYSEQAERQRLQKYVSAATLAGAISIEEGDRWLTELEDAARHGHYQHAVAVFIVKGQKL